MASDPSLPQVHIASSPARADGSSTRWWKESKDKAPAAMVQVAKTIENSPAQKARERAWLTHARLYANSPVASLYRMATRSSTMPTRRNDESPQNRINYNVVQSCTDTAAAKIAKNKTRALFLTSGGSWAQQQRSKGLTKYCDGWAEATQVYEKGQRVFVDAAGIFDVGLAKVYPDLDAGEVCVDRVLPWEVLVDDTDGLYGDPRSMFQRKYVAKDLLIDRFASQKTDEARRLADMIARATGGDPLLTGAVTDVVPVYEGWHLRSGEKAGDGMRLVAIEGVDRPLNLGDMDWTKPWFPFAEFRWNMRPIGWWGQSLAEQLTGIQIEIGRVLRTIQRCQHLVSVPRILVEVGSEIVEAHINNEIGALVKYRGIKPEIWLASGVPRDLYEQLDRLVKSAYELTGISQLSANSRKPEGLDAAVALREFHDIESERFVVVAQRFERFYLDIFRRVVEVSRDLYEKHPNLMVRAPGTKLLEDIGWKDVQLDEDRYVMRAYPTSILPTTPAAKLQTVQELYGSQMLTDQSPAGVWARSLLDFPDMESYLSLEQAALQDVQRLVGQIVDDGVFEPADEYVPPEMVITIGHNAYLKGLNDELPEDRLEMLRRLVQEAQDSLPAPAPPAALPPMAAAGAQPMAAPGAPGAPGLPAGVNPAVPSDLAVVPQPGPVPL